MKKRPWWWRRTGSFEAITAIACARTGGSLFDPLNALHSLNDKLKKSGQGNLFSSASFAALRSLRNLFHHQAELLHDIKLVHSAGIPNLSGDRSGAGQPG